MLLGRDNGFLISLLLLVYHYACNAHDMGSTGLSSCTFIGRSDVLEEDVIIKPTQHGGVCEQS